MVIIIINNYKNINKSSLSLILVKLSSYCHVINWLSWLPGVGVGVLGGQESKSSLEGHPLPGELVIGREPG